jgi:hypothetical protein
MEGGVRRSLAAFWTVLLLASPASAYIDQPATNLTLPKLIQEFKLIEFVKAEKVDLEKGYVVWTPVERLRDDAPAKSEAQSATRPADGSVRHLLKISGAIPPALHNLKPGQQAVHFSRDGYNRSVILVDGCWYVAGWDKDPGRWRIAYTDRHYDFNACFVGSPAQLIDAIRTLQKGEEVVVDCRIKEKEPALQKVRYNPKKPKERTVVAAAATRPN